MKYTDLEGCEVDGEVWSQGPVANSVWVLNSNGAHVVKVSKVKGVEKRIEVEYEPPQHVPPVPAELEAYAQDIVDTYREQQTFLLPLLGPTTPVDPNYDAAVAILAQARASRESRPPFINAHSGNLAVSDRKLKELSSE